MTEEYSDPFENPFTAAIMADEQQQQQEQQQQEEDRREDEFVEKDFSMPEDYENDPQPAIIPEPQTSKTEKQEPGEPRQQSPNTPVPAPRVAKSSESSYDKKPNAAIVFPSLFDIQVADPEKKGDGMNAYMAYTVTTKTTSPEFQNPLMTVSRRFTNFVWLYGQLTAKHPGVIVPPIPEKQTLGRFESEFVEYRRAALEKCLRKIAEHPILSKSPDFRLFIEAADLEGELKKKKEGTKKNLLSSLTDAMQSATQSFSKIPETDEWFENKRSQLDLLENQLKSLLKAVETFVKQRNECALAMGDFAGSLSSLSSSEIGKALGACLAHLGEVEKQAQDVWKKQSAADGDYLESVVEEYLRIVGSAKVALDARMKAYASWKSLDAGLIKKKEQAAKQAQQGKGGKSSADVEEGEMTVEKAKQNFDEITELLKKELARFEDEKLADFQRGMVQFAHAMVDNQKKLIALWEGFLPEVQALQ